jgi:hypothetical protein
VARLLGAISIAVLLSGCGGEKAVVAGGELQKTSDVGGLSAIAEAEDGTVLLEWTNNRVNLESYALPGKGWSKPEKLPTNIGVDAVAFNGRGERLAVWGGLTFDVRRPGSSKALLHASPSPFPRGSDAISTPDVIGSNGCDFLVEVDQNKTGSRVVYQNLFLVSCEPDWSVTRVQNEANFGYGFDRDGTPALLRAAGRPDGRYLILYATIRRDGSLARPKTVALLTRQQAGGNAGLTVQGARQPMMVWIAGNGEIWQVTPEGATRLSASKGPLAPDEGFDAIADEKGRAIVSWPTVDKNSRDTTWISIPTAHGRRTERVSSGSRPVLARAGKKLFVNVDLHSLQCAIFAREGSSWKEFDLGEDRWGAAIGASGPRAAFAWTHPNYVSDQVDSTDLYTWIYPRP